MRLPNVVLVEWRCDTVAKSMPCIIAFVTEATIVAIAAATPLLPNVVLVKLGGGTSRNITKGITCNYRTKNNARGTVRFHTLTLVEIQAPRIERNNPRTPTHSGTMSGSFRCFADLLTLLRRVYVPPLCPLLGHARVRVANPHEGVQ